MEGLLVIQFKFDPDYRTAMEILMKSKITMKLITKKKE